MCLKKTKKKHYKKAKELIKKYGVNKGLNKYFSCRAEKNDKRFSKLEKEVEEIKSLSQKLQDSHIKHLGEKVYKLALIVKKLDDRTHGIKKRQK